MSGQIPFPPALIPLADKRIWLCWRWIPGKPKKNKDGETVQTWTKMPCDIGGRAVDSSKPQNHRSFGEIQDSVLHGVVSGAAIGAASNDGSWLAADLDKCRDPETGAIAGWAWNLVTAFDSYTEISPSGTGLRILGPADGWNLEEKQRQFWTGPLPGGEPGKGEIFYKSGFVTVTFAALPGFETKWSALGALASMLERRRKARESPGPGSQAVKKGSAPPEAPIEVVRETLASIVNDGSVESNWEYYNEIGMAVFRASNGSEEGRLAWDAWSAQHPKHGIEDNTEDRWNHWLTTSPPGLIGHGSLVRIAQETAKARGEVWTPGPLWRSWRTDLREKALKAGLGPIKPRNRRVPESGNEPRTESLPGQLSEPIEGRLPETSSTSRIEPNSTSVPMDGSDSIDTRLPAISDNPTRSNAPLNASNPLSASVPGQLSEPEVASVPKNSREPKPASVPSDESKSTGSSVPVMASQSGERRVPECSNESRMESAPNEPILASVPNAASKSHPESVPNEESKSDPESVPHPENESNAGNVPRSESLPRPKIDTTSLRLDELVDAAAESLINAGEPIMHRAGELVWPLQREISASDGRKTVIAVLSSIDPHALASRMHAAADWIQWSDLRKANIKIQPPERVARALIGSAGKVRLPNVAGVISVPSIRANTGEFIGAKGPGYDSESSLWRTSDPGFSMPRGWNTWNPTRSDALALLAMVDQLLDEFPWRSSIDRAIGLSLLLCAVARPGMSMSPLHAFSANAPGTGKSYMADIAAAIVYGTPCPVMAISPKEDETEKRLVGLLSQGRGLISLDNVNGILGSDLLNQATSQPMLSLRRLGTSNISDIENTALITANGNGLTFRGDQVRRVLLALMETDLEFPENRRFKNNPVSQVLNNRGTYAAACLWILRAHALAGWPGAEGLPPVASFEEYTRCVRGALVWLGRDDPFKSADIAQQKDPDRQDFQALLFAWRDATAVLSGRRGDGWYTLREIEELSRGNFNMGRASLGSGFASSGDNRQNTAIRLRDALTNVAGDGRGGVDLRRFAKWMLVRQDRKGPGGLSFERRLSESTSVNEWRLAGTPSLRLIEGGAEHAGD